eukprot:g1695.t1
MVKDREKQAQKAKEQFVPRPVQYSLPLEDVVHFLQARLRLPDCNACVAFDNIQSKYASTEQTAILGLRSDAVQRALGVHRAAALEDFEAAEEAELRDVRDSLKSAEEKANAAQAHVQEIQGQLDSCLASTQHLEKCEGSEEALTEKVHDMYQTSLGFEVVGGIYGNAPVSIDVEGITAFPGISSDPRNVFMRRVKTKPASGYASKQYVASSGIFEFGPLLVGRSPDAKDEASEPYLKQHIENFRITNNSFLKADVAFSLASAAKWQFEATPSVPEGFEVTTMEGVLAVGEEKLISVIFKSETACVHKFKLTLQISDVEGLRSWENAAELNVQAEAFVVDVVPQFPEEATGLDFGDVRVGELVEKSFQVGF